MIIGYLDPWGFAGFRFIFAVLGFILMACGVEGFWAVSL